MTDAANTSGAQPPMPLFYKNPVPVDVERHKGWGVKKDRSFSYAAVSNALPIVLEEFPTLHAHYPIVFTAGDTPAVVVLTGIRPNENVFVDEAGRWKANTPIPAYVRRYPFIFMESPDRERLILSVEEDASVVGPDGEFKLFDGDQAGEAGKDALNFCGIFNQSAKVTQEFCQEIKQRGLLVDQQANVTTPDGRRVSLSGFCVIDEKKFNELPDEVFVEWRKRNWIGLIYTHMLSLGRWSQIVEMAAQRGNGGDQAA